MQAPRGAENWHIQRGRSRLGTATIRSGQKSYKPEALVGAQSCANVRGHDAAGLDSANTIINEWC